MPVMIAVFIASPSDRMAWPAIERNFIGFKIPVEHGAGSTFPCRRMRCVDCDRTRRKIGVDVSIIDPNLVGFPHSLRLAAIVRNAQLAAWNFGCVFCWA